MTNYVVQQTFESDDSSAISKAAAWLLLKGKDLELDTVVGDSNYVSVFYQEISKTQPDTPVTGSLKVATTTPRGPGNTDINWGHVVSGKAG